MTGGSVSADEILRIQAVLVKRNGDYLLQGFAGSAVSNLAVKMNNFSALTEMVRNAYAGRVGDVLMVRV